MLPVELVFVRHGQSEINKAIHLSRQGDHSAFTPKLRNTHTSRFHLTELGQMQAAQVGAWIRKNLPGDFSCFHRYFTSPYFRAMETAALMKIPGATWEQRIELGERDWGGFENYPENERCEKFPGFYEQWKREPFNTKPPGGESLAQKCLWVRLFLDMLEKYHANERVIVVCHADVIQVARFLLENIPLDVFESMIAPDRREDQIYNCQVFEYSRLPPKSGNISDHLLWSRTIRPTESPAQVSEWREIPAVRRYSNEELLELASRR
jgi:broad specificity phosphatase PhoE